MVFTLIAGDTYLKGNMQICAVCHPLDKTLLLIGGDLHLELVLSTREAVEAKVIRVLS
jgi:hypothetical protein